MVSLLSMGNSRGSQDIRDESIDCNGLTSDPISSGQSYTTQTDPKCVSKTSISTISGLHSHRNVKPVHQMVLAESMFDPSLPLNINCRLNPSLRQTLSDNNIFPYFVQFMESFAKNSKYWIRFYIQTECLIVSQSNVNSNTNSNDEFRQQFIIDSIGLYDKYLSDSSPNSISVDFPQEI